MLHSKIVVAVCISAALSAMATEPPPTKPEAQYVVVMGNVRYKQAILWSPELTVRRALAYAGANFAHRLVIKRGSERIDVNLRALRKDSSQNHSLKPGDAIEVE